MLGRLSSLAARNAVIVLVVTAALSAVSVMIARNLPVDAQPDISPRQVLVVTQAPGLAAPEVERLATQPVEFALQGLPLVQQIRSISRYGLSVTYVKFDDAQDPQVARDVVFAKLAQLVLPAGIGPATLGPASTGLGEVFQFELAGPGRDLMEARSILDWQVAPRLRQVPGVADVNVNGGYVRTFEVTVDPDALARRGIALAEVLSAVERSNGARGGATLERNGEQAVIRGDALVRDVQDLGRIVLRTYEGGMPLLVRDVAQVAEAPRPRLGSVTRDGRGETVVGVVLMATGANARNVATAVQKAIDEIGPSLPPGFEIRPYYDRSTLIQRTIQTVTRNLAEGAILVITVLLLMLGSLRVGIAVALAIPLSMCAALAAMTLTGLSANLMSLGAIDFGLVVDGAVVVMDAAARHRAMTPRLSRIEAAALAAREVARPVSFGILIIIVVYLPILSLQGIEGKLFRPMAATVVFALIAALAIAILVAPALASIALPRSELREARLPRLLSRVYAPVLAQAMRRPGLAVLGAVLLAILGGGAASRLGAEFVPRLDEGALTVTTLKLPSISLENAVETQSLVERTLKQFPEVVTAVTLGGSSEIPQDPMGVEQSDTFVILRPQSEWTTAKDREGLVKAMSEALDRDVPGMGQSWSQPIEMRMQDLIQGARSDVSAVIYGPDPAVLRRVADDLARAVTPIQGQADIRVEQTAGQPFVSVVIDRERIARLGVQASEVLDFVETMGGRTVGTVVRGVERIEVRVRMAEASRRTLEVVRALRVTAGDGRAIPLSELATVSWDQGEAQISRAQLRRRITVETNVRGRDIASFVTEAQDRVRRQVQLPPGYSVEWGGQFHQLQEATAQLLIVVPIALGIVLLLLWLTFGSTLLAALIFVNVPISASGGAMALWLTSLPFSVSAAVGFVALAGIAVLNGVVLVDATEARRHSGESPPDAARHAAIERLRPVLTTALVAGLGFLPMAISTSAGAEVQRPLATVVIGGLLTTTPLTLLVIPAVYESLFRWRDSVLMLMARWRSS